MAGNTDMDKVEELAQEIGRRFNRAIVIVRLKEFGCDYGFETDYSDSLGAYMSNDLSKLTDNQIVDLVEEYDIEIKDLDIRKAKTRPLKPEHDSSPAKVFISHLATNKVNANSIKNVLEKYNIKGFVAHTDIEPLKPWQDEIEKALNEMDFFIALHTKGFSKSIWCQQEVAFAVAKKVEIISIRFDEDPVGFTGRYQALATTHDIAKDVKNIFDILQKSDKTKKWYSVKIASKVAQKPIEQFAGKYKKPSRGFGRDEMVAYTNFLEKLSESLPKV